MDVKILTAEFKLGDALIFGMYNVHSSFENHAKVNKIRLTCGISFQPKIEPKDPSYFSPKLLGSQELVMLNLIVPKH